MGTRRALAFVPRAAGSGEHLAAAAFCALPTLSKWAPPLLRDIGYLERGLWVHFQVRPASPSSSHLGVWLSLNRPTLVA